MFADFSDLIEECGRELELQRRRRKPKVNGRKRQPELEAPVCFVGSLQNPRDSELQELPENQRRESVRSLYTTLDLCLGGVGEDFESDQIRDPVDDVVYEVYAIRPWGAEGNFNRYLVRRVGQ